MTASDIDWQDIVANDATEQAADEFLAADLPEIDPDLVTDDNRTDEPSTDILVDKPQSATSKRYEKKTKGILSGIFKICVASPKTVPDAAAILYYERRVSRAAGDLADANATAKRVLDFLTEGTNNPALDFAIASAPLILQLARNHEKALEPKVRGFRIPFTKRVYGLRIKLGIRLGQWRAQTHDPNTMTVLAFTDEGVAAAMRKAGITVAVNPNGRSH